MASINVGETDFDTLAGAAIDARDRGDIEQARQLDKLARKVNAALTGQSAFRLTTMMGMPRRPVRWQDMPSTIGDETSGG